MSVLGVIATFGFVSGMLSFETVPYYLDIPGTFYANFHIAYFYASETGFRLCGLFNEPGYFGTILALYLVASGLNIRKWENVSMMVAGILTLSAAFFLLIGSYWVLTHYKSKKMWFTFIIIIVSVMSIANYEFENQAINSTIQRFSLTNKDGIFNSENRAEAAFNNFYKSFVASDNFLTGLGGGYVAHMSLTVASYKVFIIDYGIVGFLIMFGSLLCSALHFALGNKYKVIYVLIFFLSATQRPLVFALPYFLALFGGLHYIKYQIEDPNKI